MTRTGMFLAGVAFVASTVGAQEASALTFNLIDYNHNLQGTAAEKDFRIAADYWSSVLTSNATVNLQIGYTALGANIIGSTSSNRASVSTANVYGQLAATGNSALDAIAVGHLKPLDASGGLAFVTNSNAGGKISKTAKVYDADGSVNNRNLSVDTSVLKALGFGGYDAAIDGRINFSSAFAFDFDPSNGIRAGRIDFLGVAIHEMGHALGFVSGVDTYDFYATSTSSPGSGVTINLNNSPIFSTLDLFRYSADPGNIAPGAGPALDLSTGTASYFSIDGGSVYNGAYLSTGQYAGNGRQASHFRDSSGCGVQIGIMDPTFCTAQMGVVTGDDIAAFDALGWNVGFDALANASYTRSSAQIYARFENGVPEPASWAMMGVGFALIGATMRRRAFTASRRPA